MALLAAVFDLLLMPKLLEDGFEVLAATLLGGGFICLAAVRCSRGTCHRERNPAGHVGSLSSERGLSVR